MDVHQGLPPHRLKGGGAVAGEIHAYRNTKQKIDPHPPLSKRKDLPKKFFYSLEFVDIKSRRDKWQDFR
jgi:hypothetical protein